MTRRLTGLTIAAACLASLVTAGPASASNGPGCFDPGTDLTVEEDRLDDTLGDNPQPVAARIIQRGGMARTVAAFERGLCRVSSPAEAERLIDRHGERLWDRAADPGADLPADDDRRLYWARLASTKLLRQWTPSFTLTSDERAALEKRLEYSSRGITDTGFRTRTAERVLVSGFDPFGLDDEVRRGNPAGAAALRLDDTITRVDGRLVEIQAVVFPVRYADFDAGIVEDVFAPRLPDIDMFTTISQGRPDAFDLEVFNGRRRSVESVGDNNNEWGGGTPSAPVEFPGVGEGPEFTETSLPHQAMLDGDDRPFDVRRNPSVTEIPEGGTEPVERPDGPTPGSTAVSGSGGGYLSNEVAYRATLLRDDLAPRLPGGHVHTPVLTMAPDNTDAITDPVFEANRADIVVQTTMLARLAAATLDHTSG